MSTPMDGRPTVLQVALRLAAAGISVFPIRADGTKASAGSWKPYQERIATPSEIHELFQPGLGIAMIAGAVSGNLEIVDVEKGAPYKELTELIETHAPGLLARLVIISTPSGGAHLCYRAPKVEHNQKLAMLVNDDGKPYVIIETRGTGGYVVTIFSPPECHPTGREYVLIQGRLTELPEISEEERDILLSCCRSFNTYIKDREVQYAETTNAGTPAPNELRPGDDFNARGDGLAVLLRHGWTITSRRGNVVDLKRPGKTAPGISANFGKVAPNMLHVFSSNAEPFEMGRGYRPFSIYVNLEHNGDPRAAAKQLASEGFGSQPPAKRTFHEELSAQDVPAESKPVVSPITEMQALLILAQTSHTADEDSVALLFEHQHADKLRYCKAWGTWLHWDGIRWKPENTNLALNFCRELARICNFKKEKSPAKASFAKGVETHSAASRIFATTYDEWDRDDHLLCTPGGTVNLKTHRMKPNDRVDYITKCTNVTPAPGPHPIFDKFMRDITLTISELEPDAHVDSDLIQYHQRSLGSILSGARTDHWILFWLGEGRNGKNTLGDLICWILGGYAKVIPTETLMSNTRGNSHPTDLASLRGIRLAVSSEVPEGSYWNEARIKSLTGDDMISARFMHQDFFEFRRTHKHLIYGNHRPMLRVVDEAIKARMHVVPFKNKFDGELCDPDMAAKLRTEAPQILQWLVDGHEMWEEAGKLRKCSSVQAETDSYFEIQATPDLWITERCTVTPSDEAKFTQASVLYKDFASWKEARGEGVISQTRWGEWMSARYKKGRDPYGGRITYLTITLNPLDGPPYDPRSKAAGDSDYRRY